MLVNIKAKCIFTPANSSFFSVMKRSLFSLCSI